MAVNKNFVVKNGIEVNENLIVSDIADKFVGIGTSTPNYTLHVFGGIGATDVRVTGISTFIQSLYVGSSGTTFSVVDTLAAGGGTNPAVGIGTDVPAYMLDIRSPVSTGQTALYVQGDARITGDFIADDITLDQANFTNIEVAGFTTTRELVVGYGASIAGITTFGYLSRESTGAGGTSLTWDDTVGIATNLQVIGNAYIEGDLKIRNDLDIDTNLFIVGILTSQNIHVGSALTVAGISTFMSDVNVGGKVQTGLEIAGVTTTASSGGITTTGGDLWVGNNFYVAGTQTIDSDLYIIGIATVGILTVTTDANVGSSLTVGGDVEIGGVLNSLGGITTTGGDLYVSGLVGTGLSVVGVSTFNTDVNVLGDLTVSGGIELTGDLDLDELNARNLDVTGIATIHTLGVTSTTTTQDLAVGGASTITGHVSLGATVGAAGSIFFPDSKGINFGSSDDLQIYHIDDSGGQSIIAETGTGDLQLRGTDIQLKNADGSKIYLEATDGGKVDIRYDNSTKFETSPTGAVVTGILTASGIGSFGSSVNVVGAQFVGGDLTVGGDLNVTGDISYDEVTGRNLNITGIATIHTLGVTSTTTTTDLAVGAAATVSGRLTAQDVLVGNASTITGVLSVSDTTESTTKDTGAVLIEGGVGIEKNLNLGTTIKMDSTAGVITATTFSGVGEVIGIGSEGTPIGTGVSFIDFRSTTGTALSCQPAVNGIATVTVTPGASLGMVLALGG